MLAGWREDTASQPNPAKPSTKKHCRHAPGAHKRGGSCTAHVPYPRVDRQHPYRSVQANYLSEVLTNLPIARLAIATTSHRGAMLQNFRGLKGAAAL